MALEFDPVPKSQIKEFNKVRIPHYGYIAVYHILLMKDALKNIQGQGDPQKFIQEYGIDFTNHHSDCRFHADLSVFRKKGLYLPPDYPDEGHYFSHDPLNISASSYLVYRSRKSPETIALAQKAYDICDHHWTANDFSDAEKLQQGLIHGQLMWLGNLSSYKHFEEPELDTDRSRLVNGVFEYYKTQIGPIDINEGDSVADFTVEIGGEWVKLGS